MRRADWIAGAWAAAALAAAAPVQASPERGRQLYELHCGGCHYERVHERDRWRSRITTMADLRAEVERWSRQTKHSFTAEDLGDIVEYLDRSHYQLRK
jgi:mono/diheme cytochrome c family protein